MMMEIAKAITMNKTTMMMVVAFEVGVGVSSSPFFFSSLFLSLFLSLSGDVDGGVVLDGFASLPVGSVGFDGVGVCFG